MPLPQPHPLPEQALLARYTRSGGFTDCYAVEVPKRVSHAEFVEAFYSGKVFKLERLLLGWFAHKPSTLAHIKALAAGSNDDFAAWKVEARSTDQLLLCDFTGRTRSWLMVAPLSQGPGAAETTGTRLYFGSAVVPRYDKATGQARMGAGFTALLGFHKLYSRVLLAEARARVTKK